MRPRRSPVKTCLLIIDMINEFQFNGAARVMPAVEQAARRIAGLKRRMKLARLPIVYVNDNFEKWRSDFRKLVAPCLKQECRGKQIARILLPEEDDYFVLKPKHSGFYATPLELLLRYLKVGRVIITGIAGDNCVLFTAADAHMRELDVAVPSDCDVSLDAARNRSALEHMRVSLNADTQSSEKILFARATYASVGSASSLKPIDQFKEMQIGAAAVWAVDGRVGIMLKMIPGTERSGKAACDTEGPYELKRTPEILRAECMTGEQPASSTHIDRHKAVLPAEGNVQRHESEYAGGIFCAPQNAGRPQHAHSEEPAVADIPFPRKPRREGHITLVELYPLLFSQRRTAAEPPSQLKRFKRELPRSSDRGEHEDQPRDCQDAAGPLTAHPGMRRITRSKNLRLLHTLKRKYTISAS
jgi:nicotinamidase-related amidase